jgi:RHS repeat-associated protein
MTYSYDANDQLSSDGYDLSGNTANFDGHTYTYDFEKRLKSKDGTTATLVYDGDGSRVAKTIGGVTTKFLVDDLNPTGYLQVLEEVSGGEVKVAYTYGTTGVSQRRNGVTNYYGYDAHGNVTFLADAAGMVTDTYDYDAWGTLVASSGTTQNTRMYVGEEFDPNLGLINLRARAYDPSRGRFPTLDPQMGQLGNPVTFNRYLYAGGDPVNHIDPTGRSLAAELVVLTLISASLVRDTNVRIAYSDKGPAVYIDNTSVTVAVGLQIACAFWTAADAIVNLTYHATGSDRDTAHPPYPWTYCEVSSHKTW